MGEPYIIKAGEFDPEKQERQLIGYANEWVRKVPGITDDGKPIVVRDKPTLERVLTEHWDWLPGDVCKGCDAYLGNDSSGHVAHMAAELRAAGLVNG